MAYALDLLDSVGAHVKRRQLSVALQALKSLQAVVREVELFEIGQLPQSLNLRQSI